MVRALLHLVLVVSFVCCNPKKNASTAASHTIVFSVPGLNDTIRSYAKAHVEDFEVLSIDVERSYDTTTFYIAATSSLQEVPSFYFISDGKPVLIYTGVESSVKFDSIYENHIRKLTGQFLREFDLKVDKNGQILNVPATSVPVIWEVNVVASRIVLMEIYDSVSGRGK